MMYLSATHRRLIYAACALLYASGVLWLLFHYGVQAPDDSASARHPAEAWSLRLHGAMAMAFLIALGSLLPLHVRRAWAQRRNFATGIAMISGATVLALTGWGLYYVGDEMLREWLSVGHWLIGVSAAPLLTLHVLTGKARAAKQTFRTQSPETAD
jgi:hypothetical protein